MIAAPARTAFKPFQRLRSRNARARIEQVAAGSAAGLDLDLDSGLQAAEELLAVAAALPARTAPVRRLRTALDPRSRAVLMDLLGADEPALRRLGARLCGALELEEAVPWLASALEDGDGSVREAAARALGRIGGGRAADALLAAFAQGAIPWFRLTVELAKAAPHLYLEQAVSRSFWVHERPAVIAAIGLRTPGAGGADFLAAVPVSGPRDLIAACHVLARAGAWAPVSWISSLLDHQDHRVRAAADRALRRLRSSSQAPVYVLGGSR